MGFPQLDNLDNVHFDLRVDPACRRRGVGTALLDFALNRARELGRKRAMTQTRAQLPGTDEAIDPAFAAFAEKFGFKASLREVRRALDLTTVDDAELDRMLADAWARADGYRLVRWQAPAPDDLIEGIAYLDGRLVTDAPMGDLPIEPERVDAERIRKAEQGNLLRGRTPYNMGVIHEASGRLAAWTLMVSEDEVPWHAWQYITIVDPDHRGHRLGTLVKIENLKWFRAQVPGVRVITTFNAASNAYMIDINEKMGFRAEHAFENWQLEL
jgi:GNAT superfamily N-acetyltransferase